MCKGNAGIFGGGEVWLIFNKHVTQEHEDSLVAKKCNISPE